MEERFDRLGELPLIVQALEEHPNFTQFSGKELEVFAGYCIDKTVKKGEQLFSEGETGSAMFIVKKGSIKILKEGFLGETVLTQINPGEFLGEMAVIDGSPRSAAAKAAVDSELLEIKQESFEKMKKEHPETAIKIMDLLLKLLSYRLRITTLKMLKK